MWQLNLFIIFLSLTVSFTVICKYGIFTIFLNFDTLINPIVKRFAPFFILIIVFFTSCSIPQYVTVPVNYGPKMGFSRDSTTIVVVNRYQPDSAKIRDYRRINVLKKMAVISLQTAAGQLEYLKGVHIINLVDSINYAVNTDSVKFLAAANKANYVLVLNDVTAGIYPETVYYNGVPSNYYATKIKTSLSLFESNGIYSKKLVGMAEVPQDEVYSGGFASLFYRPSYRSSVPAITTATREATLDALKDYLPFSISNERPLYADGGQLESSVMQIKAGKFDGAFKILNPLIDGADVKLASKAAYNLAVVYEAQGDIEEALKTAKLSNQKHPNDYAKAIIVDLMKE
jgi:tetratricopeptide (TPR) repeat protein